jgi:DNA helicase-2/ATP-dependent DNA helicase PcrA
MSTDFLSLLNKDQIEAVTYSNGPSIILAGAGSGKTKVLTYKAAYLISNKHVNPNNILLLTFTNKAAGEMLKRINHLLDKKKFIQKPYAGTFHAFCAKFIRCEGQIIGIPNNYVIYDEQDSKEAIKDAIRKLNIDLEKYSVGAIKSSISQIKNEMISPADYLSIAKGAFQEIIAKIYPLYQNILKESFALDFDDLLLKTVYILNKNPDIAKKYSNRYLQILVDEYQDTNKAQYKLILLLLKNHQNITVVGDASQSIYSWRGADYQNIMNFTNDFKNAKRFYLEQNYRSHQNILDASNQVISKNKSHPVLKLWTDKPAGHPIKLYQADSEVDESNFIVEEFCKLKSADKNLKLSDVAVLYRTNSQSRNLEEVLLHQGIPYILYGGIRFYERKEIKDIISYLRLIINPLDRISYNRAEKIGKKRLKDFLEYLEMLNKVENYQNMSTLEILDGILKHTAYLDKFDKNNPIEFERLENIKELKSVAAEFTKLTDFLENIALVEQESLSDHPYLKVYSNDAINLMTIHASKGLEFKIIFMVGMEEGLFPHSKSIFDPFQLEEERRLCYVGMTRAKEHLYLTYAKKRLYFGQISTNQTSRFISDISENLIQFTGKYFI